MFSKVQSAQKVRHSFAFPAVFTVRGASDTVGMEATAWQCVHVKLCRSGCQGPTGVQLECFMAACRKRAEALLTRQQTLAVILEEHLGESAKADAELELGAQPAVEARPPPPGAAPDGRIVVGNSEEGFIIIEE
jgi:hypothetical protein